MSFVDKEYLHIGGALDLEITIAISLNYGFLCLLQPASFIEAATSCSARSLRTWLGAGKTMSKVFVS